MSNLLPSSSASRTASIVTEVAKRYARRSNVPIHCLHRGIVSIKIRLIQNQMIRYVIVLRTPLRILLQSPMQCSLLLRASRIAYSPSQPLPRFASSPFSYNIYPKRRGVILRPPLMKNPYAALSIYTSATGLLS